MTDKQFERLIDVLKDIRYAIAMVGTAIIIGTVLIQCSMIGHH